MKRSRRSFPWLALCALLSLDVVVWMCEKKGVSFAGAGDISFLRAAVAQPLIWFAVAMGPLQLWLWIRILAGGDLSLAYPLTSLAYPLTMICARFVFHEHINGLLWMGAILITAGVALIGSSKQTKLDG